jgi:tRNA A-37 threonylcarbamoyl transferase component Bud32
MHSRNNTGKEHTSNTTSNHMSDTTDKGGTLMRPSMKPQRAWMAQSVPEITADWKAYETLKDMVMQTAEGGERKREETVVPSPDASRVSGVGEAKGMEWALPGHHRAPAMLPIAGIAPVALIPEEGGVMGHAPPHQGSSPTAVSSRRPSASSQSTHVGEVAGRVHPVGEEHELEGEATVINTPVMGRVTRDPGVTGSDAAGSIMTAAPTVSMEGGSSRTSTQTPSIDGPGRMDMPFRTKSESTTAASETSPSLMSASGVDMGRTRVGDWLIGKTIGEGSSGKVKLATHSVTGQQCVVKAVRRPRQPAAASALSLNRELTPEEREVIHKFHKRELYMLREAVIGMSLHHPNIVHLHASYLGENHFYCFFDYMEGEDLVDYITRQGRLKEKRARSIFRSLIAAVEFAHRHHIVHRDLKLENIRYDERTNTTKLLDFGFATYWREVSFLHTNCGSPCYAAPEIYDHKAYQGPEIDVWSLGICLYGAITGGLPFDGPSFTILAQRVKRCDIYYPAYLSSGALYLWGVLVAWRTNKKLAHRHQASAVPHAGGTAGGPGAPARDHAACMGE